MSRAGSGFQNLGFQVQDFAVQVAGRRHIRDPRHSATVAPAGQWASPLGRGNRHGGGCGGGDPVDGDGCGGGDPGDGGGGGGDPGDGCGGGDPGSPGARRRSIT